MSIPQRDFHTSATLLPPTRDTVDTWEGSVSTGLACNSLFKSYSPYWHLILPATLSPSTPSFSLIRRCSTYAFNHPPSSVKAVLVLVPSCIPVSSRLTNVITKSLVRIVHHLCYIYVQYLHMARSSMEFINYLTSHYIV